MKEIITIGLDIAKSVFQVHGIDKAGEVVVRRQLKRRQVLQFFAGLKPCLVGMEACATAHHWARELNKLGHEVRLMPPRYVKPYVKRNKNDAADAEAICEAVTRPTMRFVPVKTVEQQSVLMFASDTAAVHPPADVVDQLDPRSPGRVRHRRRDWSQWRGSAARSDRQGGGGHRSGRGASLPACLGGAARAGEAADPGDRSACVGLASRQQSEPAARR